MPAITRFDPPVTAPVIDQPRLERREQGAPQRATWTLYESAGKDLAAGIWACEVGRWRIEFPPHEDEYFFVLEGHARLHDEAGGVVDVRAGQAAVIPGGFQGSFEVVEPVRKHFVVIDRSATP
ncbi:MAG: hypothetical protein RL722_1592 [Pseudomonadota bacterium]|jgi:uncharacterized cupin superfamily protein